MKYIIPILMFSVLFTTNLFASPIKHGFDLANSIIPVGKIFSGGPPRDGIPSIDKPKFIKARDVNYLKPSDRVLGVEINGKARAYPIRILNWHEIVNDVLNQCLLKDTSGKLLPSINTFWFAWYAFHPDTELFKTSKK